ncbi:MAG: DUF4843 domain-containing protein [Bacteroidales bacterium]
MKHYIIKRMKTSRIFSCLLFTFLVGALGTIYSCKNDYETYSGDCYIQFGPDTSVIYESSRVYDDTIKSYSFIYEGNDVVRQTIYFDLYALGGIKDYDRSFKLMQVAVPNALNAVPDVHYLAFDNPEVSSLYVIKAGETHLSVPIVLLRDTSLSHSIYTLKIELQANEEFLLGTSELLWRKVYFTDIITEPNAWSVWEGVFGDYSRVKHLFMIDATGQKFDDEFFEKNEMAYTAMYGYAAKCKEELAKYNVAHPNAPLRDENGVLIIFP